MSAVAGFPGLSELLSWPTEHLTEAAGHWAATGERSFGLANQVWRDALSVDWQGEAAEALRSATHADMLTTSAVADQLREAAKVARIGASDLYAARSRVRYAVEDARSAEFVVNEDLSVTDRLVGGSAAQRAARHAQVQALAADIRQRAAQQVALDQQVAWKVTAAVAGIRDAFPPSPVLDAPQPKPKIQAVDRHWKQDPTGPKPPFDPAQLTPEQVRADYERLKAEIRDHNSSRPPQNDAGAVAAYNREADALNARKAALEAKLGKVETAPAHGTRLVPDWGQPAPEQQTHTTHRFDTTTAHAHDLGTDPATGGGFRPNEAETGLRVEAQRGISLQRSPHPGADWIDPASGSTYDAVGNFDGRYLNMDAFLKEINNHLGKADYVPVDVSLFNAEQRAAIRRFIADRRRLLRWQAIFFFSNVIGRVPVARWSM